jgi:hypothetical protein
MILDIKAIKEILAGSLTLSTRQIIKLVIVSYVAAMLWLSIMFISSDHEIRCYYFKDGTLYADIDWAKDMSVNMGIRELKLCAGK